MSDRHTRTLERRSIVARTGATRTAWIAARIRSGDLSRVRVAIAAHAGDAAAHSFFPDMPWAAPPTSVRELERWARRLRHFGPEVELRAIVAMVEHAIRCAQVRIDHYTAARLDAAQAWVDHPMPHERQAAARAASLEHWCSAEGERVIVMAAWACASAAGQERRGIIHHVATQAIRESHRVQAPGCSVPELHAAACAALLAWALE